MKIGLPFEISIHISFIHMMYIFSKKVQNICSIHSDQTNRMKANPLKTNEHIYLNIFVTVQFFQQYCTFDSLPNYLKHK